jgi:hypothetical protein
MKKEQEKEAKQKIETALEVGKFLPETKQKVEYYKNVMKAEAGLITALGNAIADISTSEVEKARFNVEVIERTNSLITKTKVYENYLARKKNYEGFLDEMSREVAEFLDTTLSNAKELTYNIRLMDSIARFDKHENPSMQEKVEFYLYLKQEILNAEKHKGKRFKEQVKGKVVSMIGENVDDVQEAEEVK